MSNALKFFAENISFLPNPASLSRELQREYNLNAGLRALAMQLNDIESRQKRIEQDLSNIHSDIRRLR